MKTPVKPSLTASDIHRLVADCFGADTRIGDITVLSGGLFNAAYAIQLPDKGIETVLRVAPPPGTPLLTYETDLMRTEVAVYEVLRQHTTIPLPEIYGYNFRGDIIPNDTMFIARMKGVPLGKIVDTLPREEVAPVLHDFGACGAQIHAVRGERFGYFSKLAPPASLTWKTAFLQMVASLLSDGAAFDVSFARPSDEIYALFEKCAWALDEITEPRLIHGDFWDANVFVVQQDGRWTIEGILDCDRAIWGDPDMEYSLMFRDGQPTFFEGYGRAISDTPAARLRRQMYLTYLFLIVAVETSLRSQAVDRSQWVDQQLRDALQALERF